MIKQLYDNINRMRQHFSWDQTDTKEFLVEALLEEAHELKAALNEDEAAFKSELADVLMYALTLSMDYNIHELIQEKIEEVLKREY